MRIFQKGFNYSQDGPGNRLVYHLKGCNMRCPWCSNPEGLSFEGGSFFEMTPEEILAEAVSAKPMFFDGGGVTFTGGECTLQAEELKEALRSLKEKGIDTAIETNGTYEALPELFELIDHLIIDLKHAASDKHRQVTGVGNETVRLNISAAAENGRELLVRVPLIGGFNTDNETVNGFIELFKSIAGENVRFELLKYHEYGRDKWLRLGLPYMMENAFVTEETRRGLEEKMKLCGLKVVRT